MDQLPVSRFTDAVVVGRVALESSINKEVRFYFNVDRFFDRKPYASGRKSSFLEKVKRTLEEDIALVSKRVKAIQLADKNELVVGRNDPIPLETINY